MSLETLPLPFLSVIIPAYNEAQRLPMTLEHLQVYFSRQAYSVEILVVDDGSTDETRAVVKAWQAKMPALTLLENSQNQGKGAVVRQGMLAAQGAYRLLYDADGATPIQEIERLLPWVSGANVDIAIGSRAKPSSETHVHGHFHRKLMGRIFTALVFPLVPGVYDTQCGFKLFKASAAATVFSQQTLNGFAFDVEILHIAQCQGLAIQEVPVNWQNVKGSKVHLVFDSAKMFLSLFQIGFNQLRGRYY